LKVIDKDERFKNNIKVEDVKTLYDVLNGLSVNLGNVNFVGVVWNRVIKAGTLNNCQQTVQIFRIGHVTDNIQLLYLERNCAHNIQFWCIFQVLNIYI
jgi:hypothetical protein